MPIYKFYNSSGDLVAYGSARECAEKFGISAGAVTARARACMSGESTAFRVVVEKEPLKEGEKAALIKAWDDFVTPIREYYGIPVRHLEEGKK